MVASRVHARPAPRDAGVRVVCRSRGRRRGCSTRRAVHAHEGADPRRRNAAPAPDRRGAHRRRGPGARGRALVHRRLRRRVGVPRRPDPWLGCLRLERSGDRAERRGLLHRPEHRRPGDALAVGRHLRGHEAGVRRSARGGHRHRRAEPAGARAARAQRRARVAGRLHRAHRAAAALLRAEQQRRAGDGLRQHAGRRRLHHHLQQRPWPAGAHRRDGRGDRHDLGAGRAARSLPTARPLRRPRLVRGRERCQHEPLPLVDRRHRRGDGAQRVGPQRRHRPRPHRLRVGGGGRRPRHLRAGRLLHSRTAPTPGHEW